MTKEEKDLLLRDICARLPYGVMVYEKVREDIDSVVRPIDIGLLAIVLMEIPYPIIKPYLRPMSSMTKDEIKEFDEFCVIDEYAWRGGSIQGFINQAEIMQNGIDWLNARHFDYRGLINKGLALEAPEGMYKTE